MPPFLVRRPGADIRCTEEIWQSGLMDVAALAAMALVADAAEVLNGGLDAPRSSHPYCQFRLISGFRGSTFGT